MSKTYSLDAASVINAVADAAQRWSDADFPARVRATAAIAKRTGYTTPVVDYALDRLFAPLRAATLERAVAQELGSIDALDRFVERDGVQSRAYPVGSTVIVSSETTIGVAVIPAVFALCAKCPVLVKDREDTLVGAFFETLSQEYPELGQRAQARVWKGGDPAEDRDLRVADVVVAFGRDESLAAIRGVLRPGARFIGYGHRASIGYVSREALADETSARTAAQGAARDLILYDGEGCMSLHALFVERDASIAPHDFARMLIDAAAIASVEFPAGKLDPRIVTYCTGAAFRAALGRGSVLRTPSADTTLVLDPPQHEPPPLLPRILPVYSIDAPDECEEYVRSHGLPLEVFAVAAPNETLADLGARLGAARIARLGEMQSPGPGLHHGGRARIGDFIRWADVA
ncbi:MAG TPA: acyl-CoA reductase [Candidatus Acidoferrales bacterium]|nr:acyl-CoA reductase [Candidatus Acidoferrales bacterium]